MVIARDQWSNTQVVKEEIYNIRIIIIIKPKI